MKSTNGMNMHVPRADARQSASAGKEAAPVAIHTHQPPEVMLAQAVAARPGAQPDQRLADWCAAVIRSLDSSGRVEMQAATRRPEVVPPQAFRVLTQQVRALGGHCLREMAVEVDPEGLDDEMAQIREWAASQPSVDVVELTWASRPRRACTLNLFELPDTVQTVRVEPDPHVALIMKTGLSCVPTGAPSAAYGATRGVAEMKGSPEMADALAASRHALREPPKPEESAEARTRRITRLRAGKGIDGIKLPEAMRSAQSDSVGEFMRKLRTLGLTAQQVVEVLAARDEDGGAGLRVAMEEGHTEVVRVFLHELGLSGLTSQQIASALSNDFHGAHGLVMAVMKGHAETVGAFIIGAKALGITDEQFAGMVDVRLAASSLDSALSRGDTATVRAFVEGLKAFNYSADKLAVVAREVARDLLRGLKNGSVAALTVYIDEMRAMGIDALRGVDMARVSEAIEKGLQEACAYGHAVPIEGLPGLMKRFHFSREQIGALLVGRISTLSRDDRAVTACLNAVKELALTQDQLERIFASRGLSESANFDRDCVGDALKKGRAGLVAALLDGIESLGLGAKTLWGILSAEGYRETAICAAMEWGHAEAVSAYMQRLKRFNLSPEQIMQLVTGTGLQRALAKGHAPAVTAFLDGLRGLGLDAQQLMDVVNPKGERGYSGLSEAMAECRLDAVAAYMKGLGTLGLDAQQLHSLLEQRADFLSDALRSDNGSVVTAYIEGLGNTGLGGSEITQLIWSRDLQPVWEASPSSGFQRGARATYIAAIRSLEQRKCITSEQANYLCQIRE